MKENKFEIIKQQKIDALLDKLNFHKREIEKLKASLDIELIDNSDSENKIDQVIHNDVVHSHEFINKKIHEEQQVITQIELDLEKISK